MGRRKRPARVDRERPELALGTGPRSLLDGTAGRARPRPPVPAMPAEHLGHLRGGRACLPFVRTLMAFRNLVSSVRSLAKARVTQPQTSSKILAVWVRSSTVSSTRSEE